MDELKAPIDGCTCKSMTPGMHYLSCDILKHGDLPASATDGDFAKGAVYGCLISILIVVLAVGGAVLLNYIL